MKVSLNWLREFVEVPAEVNALVDLLTLAGIEVEGVSSLGVNLPEVVVGQIRESVQHPNADRLSVCKVDDGGSELRQIVCGAKNYRPGDKVPVALPGAVLPGDFKIKVGKLRGVESQGMLCSAEELGLPSGEDGLLILDSGAAVGAPLAALFPADTVFDLEVTPNRPDLLSHLGVAREIGALTGRPLRMPGAGPELGGFAEGVIDVEPVGCRFYSAVEISGLQVGPSPHWLRQKLEAVGLRSINNVVDVTNFVMLERGQPLHAFDAGKVVGAIRVRSGREGETLETLDGKSVALSSQHLVIADDEKPLALAGVMGGMASRVTEATRDIILESAWFEPSLIARTARKLGAASESSYRFERRVDLAGVLPAAQRATELIVQLTGGSPGKLSIGLAGDSPAGFDPSATLAENAGTVFTHVVPFRPERCARILGIAVSEERLREVLEGFGLRRAEGGWEVPSHRQDLLREVDLIEEVARVIGLSEIPSRMQGRFAPATAIDRAYDFAIQVRRSLVAQGFYEARSLTLVPAQPLGVRWAGASAERLQQVRNPMIEDQVVLRPNLLHGLLKALTRNLHAGAKSVRLFEVGRVYSCSSIEEGSRVGIVLSGAVSEKDWRGEPGRAADLFDMKGVVAAMAGPQAAFRASPDESLALSLEITIGSEVVGWLGQLWPADARALETTAAVMFAELDLAALARLAAGPVMARFSKIARYPAVQRDIALLSPLDMDQERVVTELLQAGESLLVTAELFDVFSDPSGVRLPNDKKSLAYSLTYRSPDRTLTSDEVNAAHGRLKSHLQERLAVTFRE